MAEALLKVSFAGPLVSIQDRGRFGHLRYGVAASGPMDRFAAAMANAALGNPDDAPFLEVSLGGISLTVVNGRLTLAFAGGGFAIDVQGKPCAPWSVITLNQGERLTIRGGAWGSWCYLAFAGRLQARSWLGHAATHSMSGFGGGAVQTGQELRIADAAVRPDRLGDLTIPDIARPTGRVRVVMGPQDHHFAQDAITAFLNTDYRLTSAFDRMGVRLDGPLIPPDGALSIPSEPILRGAVQVSGDGVPTVLLADHGTTGGYPKIATVISADLDALTQHRAGDAVRFTAVSAQDALAAARDTAALRDASLAIARAPRGTLEDRLLRENLVSGVITGDDS